ncbi:sulfurtransferase [Marisediminicola sp. LYQ85]|uniref:sulfurtransferase n=1 Tax=Marisediminicola sp. LYQ85 TaxID=3391062 RepID=UPI003983BF90
MTTGPLLISPLVSTQWLADHLGADKFVIIDATVSWSTGVLGEFGGLVTGHERYVLEGHIPGAIFADLIDGLSDPDGAAPFAKPSQERFEDAVGHLGIDNETTVIVYDTSSGEWASRLWWLFRSWGYDSVAVLDGGFVRWVAEDRAVELGHVSPLTADFAAFERPRLWADRAEVESIVAGDTDTRLVSALPTTPWRGRAPIGASSPSTSSSIPASATIPVSHLVDPSTNEFVDEAALRELFDDVVGHRVVTFCHSGIDAAADALALTLIGQEDVAVYDGSLLDWDREHALTSR